MKHSLLLTIAATLLGLTLAGCTDDIPLNLSGQSQFDEGELVEATLAVNVTTFSVSNTRADGDTGEEQPSETEEPMTDFEKQVDNIWVFQYDTEGSLLIKPRYYTAKANETDGTWSVMLKPLVASKIYVVANANSDSWASSYEGFDTEEKLLSQTLPSPYPVIPGTTEESAIPMEGVNDGNDGGGVTVSPEQDDPVVVPVTRMYAKIKVKVNIDKALAENDASVYNVTLSKIPWYCQVETLYDETNKDKSATYPDDNNTWITRAINETNDTDAEDQAEGYDYVIYIPENIQGVSVEATGGSEEGEEGEDSDADVNNKDTKTENAPTNATRLTVRISYIDYTDEEDKESSGVRSFADYTVCPGGNSVDNYNIRRNCVYRVTLNIGYPIDLSYQPSANCIYAAPGSTVYFEPYYRTEEGGGYKFSDYLDPDVEGKQIKGVKILWQTEDCIGDNTSGNLVYFEPLKNNTEQTLHDRIYVTVSQPGNAVIAAYNDEDCEGDIIWSWHIWVPNATEPDPTNEANGKLFTTYYWDSDKIYGYKDANGNVTSNPRTPGYTIMDLNLGALTSVPTTATFPETYGLLYQFGRKDPFPCARENMRGEGYADSITGPIYDDAYKRVYLTSADVNDLGNDDYLFYSISGMTSQANPSDYGIAYAIKHPTVFLCGTDSVNSTTSITRTSHYVFNGNWTNEEDTDNLWGATSVTDATKTYYVGQDKNGHDRHLYDDYGEEKSIFDPCPYGWRISPPDLWLSFTDTGLNPQASLDEVNGTYRSGCYGFDLNLQAWRSGASSFFPMQGPRTPDGCIRNSRICGNYMNATSDTDNRVNILHIHNNVESFCIFEMINPQYYFKSTGGSVRCVRETK